MFKDGFDYIVSHNGNGHIRVPKIKPFTGDTGRTLDWQVGFEDPAKQYYGFLGIGGTEKKKRQEVLDLIRKDFTAPANCSMAAAKLEGAKRELAIAEGKFKAEPGSNSLPRYIAGFNTVIAEYISYMNANCVAAPAPVGDPVLNSALPSSGGGSVTPAATGQDAAKPLGTGAVVNAASNAAAGATNALKSVPKWAWYTVGGLLVVMVGVVILKRK